MLCFGVCVCVCVVLCSAVVCCAVLCFGVGCCAVLCCAVLCCAATSYYKFNMQEAGTLEDPNWRVPDRQIMDQQYMGGGFTFAVPNAEFLDFSGPGGPALEASKLLTPCL